MTTSSEEQELPIVKYEYGHAGAPLFRPLQRTGQDRPKREVNYCVPVKTKATGLYHERRWKWLLPWDLDSTDQSVLVACLYLIGSKPEATRAGDVPSMAATGFGPETAIAGRELHLWQIARVLGWSDGGSSYKRIIECLRRLSAVKAWQTDLDTEKSASLLDYQVNKRTGAAVIRLHPHLTGAILVATGARYVQYPLDERRQLRSDAAQIAHVWLCNWIGDKKTPQAIGLDKLAGHVWADTRPVEEWSSAETRRRRHKLRQALEELTAIGWSVTETVVNGATGRRVKLTIRRPALVRRIPIAQAGVPQLVAAA